MYVYGNISISDIVYILAIVSLPRHSDVLVGEGEAFSVLVDDLVHVSVGV